MSYQDPKDEGDRTLHEQGDTGETNMSEEPRALVCCPHCGMKDATWHRYSNTWVTESMQVGSDGELVDYEAGFDGNGDFKCTVCGGIYDE